MTGTSRQTRAQCRARARAGWLAAAALAGCSGEPAPEAVGPPGAWWVGRTPAVAAVLGQLGQLEGTPLARAALQLAAVLPDCPTVGARADAADFGPLLFETRCVDPGDTLAAALGRTDAEIVFALPAERGARAHGALRFDPGALVVDLSWPRADADGALALLLPGDEPAGPDRLASRGRLVHVRVRPRGGLDLGALVPADSQADRLFRLRSDLFASAVLDGTWEGAVYLPERADGMPGVALALGFRVKSAAVAAAERFLADLGETWDVHRAALRLGPAEGACLPALNVLPDFAPCYVATDGALVVGWNPASLERALAEDGGDVPGAGARLDVDLALIHRADALIARRLDTALVPLRWPWRRLRAAGEREGDTTVWRLELMLPHEARS